MVVLQVSEEHPLVFRRIPQTPLPIPRLNLEFGRFAGERAFHGPLPAGIKATLRRVAHVQCDD